MEVSGDAATIALGENDKTTKYISKIRSDSYMEPAAAVLSLRGVPDASKVELVIMQAEALRSAIQDKKILGIEIPDPTKKKTDKIKVSALKKNELKEWINDGWQEDIEVLEDWIDGFEDELDLEEGEDTEKDDIEESYEEDGYTDDLEEWLDGFEGLDDWIDEFDEEVKNEKEEVADRDDAKKSGADVVAMYMKEIQGQALDDMKVFMKYSQAFDKLYREEVISEMEIEKLITEAIRIRESLVKAKKNSGE